MVEFYSIIIEFKINSIESNLKAPIPDALQGLYCDVRQFLNYIKETKGGTFRRVALSGLLDAVDRTPGKKTKTTKVVR